MKGLKAMFKERKEAKEKMAVRQKVLDDET